MEAGREELFMKLLYFIYLHCLILLRRTRKILLSLNVLCFSNSKLKMFLISSQLPHIFNSRWKSTTTPLFARWYASFFLWFKADSFFNIFLCEKDSVYHCYYFFTFSFQSQIVLILFLFFRRFQPQCSLFSLFLIKKKVHNIVILNIYNYEQENKLM